MSWSIVGMSGMILFGVVWVIGVIKVYFLDKRRTTKSPTDPNEYDENYPDDFDCVRKYSRKTTWTILLLSIAATVGGLAFTTIQMGRYAGAGESALPSAMGMAFTFALPCAIMWILNMVLLTKYVRREGTSLTEHAKRR